ncbi:hypothetical protein CL621_04925 [archaeon]|jgi:hypothetical protein|nr:hypothetical protein [archaeon]|tara:strand:+ start:1138 stop:1374 length:237 start_codon:yes stop_codon:yes gene_type:complete
MITYKIEVALNQLYAGFQEFEAYNKVMKRYNADSEYDSEKGVSTLIIERDKPFKLRELKRIKEKDLGDRVNCVVTLIT